MPQKIPHPLIIILFRILRIHIFIHLVHLDTNPFLNHTDPFDLDLLSNDQTRSTFLKHSFSSAIGVIQITSRGGYEL